VGIAGAVKMLIRKIEKEESNHDGHYDSHERINSETRYCFINTSGRSRFRKWNTVFFRYPLCLWKTPSWLLPGLNFIPNKFVPAGPR
jgi:hypothetical protein